MKKKERVRWRGHREGRSLCLNNCKLFMGNGWKYISALDCWQHIYWENSSYYSTMSVQQVHNARLHFPFLQKLISSQSSFRSPLVGQKATLPSTLHYSFSFQSSSGFLTVFYLPSGFIKYAGISFFLQVGVQVGSLSNGKHPWMESLFGRQQLQQVWISIL